MSVLLTEMLGYKSIGSYFPVVHGFNVAFHSIVVWLKSATLKNSTHQYLPRPSRLLLVMIYGDHYQEMKHRWFKLDNQCIYLIVSHKISGGGFSK